MSRNFEWLQAEICLDGGLKATTESVAGEAKDRARTSMTGLTNAESAVREESLKLVQRLFLAPGQMTPKS